MQKNRAEKVDKSTSKAFPPLDLQEMSSCKYPGSTVMAVLYLRAVLCQSLPK